MADVRSLLRQQRAARRIEHPYAAYSEAGKLLCTLCREVVKSESLWDGHLRSITHTQRLQNEREPREAANGNGTAHKRKHGDSESEDDTDEMDDSVRRKRSKNDMIGLAPLSLNGLASGAGDGEKEQTLTPPSLMRRQSTTPIQGVEIQIPSRPATPAHPRDGTPSASTPNMQTPLGPSPLIPQEARAASLPPRAAGAQLPAASATNGHAATIDEDEWAAFEADIAAADVPFAGANGDAIISAPAMTAEEVAAAEEEERKKRRAAADVELEDEKEEATRALENEFEEMEELEARVRRLKEKREALRIAGGGGMSGLTTGDKDSMMDGKENMQNGVDVAAGPADEEEDEEDEEDDWVGFRFRA